MEEKKARLLKFFQDEYSFYTMKELEKLVPKKCAGVSPMIVKDLIQQMIDEDGLITVEKCGNINVYWCFKNQIFQKIYDNCLRLSKQIDTTVQEVSEMKKNLEKTRDTDRCMLSYGSEGSVVFDREEQMRKSAEIAEKLKPLQLRFQQLSESRWSDKSIIEKRESIVKQLDQINSFADDIEIIIEYFSEKYHIESKLIKKELEIPEEFEEFEIQFCNL